MSADKKTKTDKPGVVESPALGAGACALAMKRHPYNPTPDLNDWNDSLTVMNAVAAWVKEHQQ